MDCSMQRLIWPFPHEHSTSTDRQGAEEKNRPALGGGFFSYQISRIS
jgi:hypothetical protein